MIRFKPQNVSIHIQECWRPACLPSPVPHNGRPRGVLEACLFALTCTSQWPSPRSAGGLHACLDLYLIMAVPQEYWGLHACLDLYLTMAVLQESNPALQLLVWSACIPQWGWELRESCCEQMSIFCSQCSLL